MDGDTFEEHYSVYTPSGVLHVHFTESGRTLSGSTDAQLYFNTMMRIGVTGEDGHMIDHENFSSDDLRCFIDGQFGLLVVMDDELL